jgi:lysophospholipase L1-like esterase
MLNRPLAVLLAAATLALGACTAVPRLPAVPPDALAVTPDFHQGTEKRHERFNAVSKEGKATLVFLGDSITEGWEGGGRATWEKFYAGRQAANFGISGDRTEHVLWRLDHGNFDGLSPKLIVLMIGTNNTGHRKDPSEHTAAGVRAILDRLRAKCPGAKVLMLAIFPRGAGPDDELRKLNEGANKLLATQADGRHVYWLDINARFLDEKGNLPKSIMPDLLHPNAEGYRIWAEAIEPEVKRLLGE